MPSPAAELKAQEPCSPSSASPKPTYILPSSPPTSPRPRKPATSPVDRLIGLIALHKHGRLPGGSDWRAYSLSPDEFAAFKHRLQHELPGLWSWFQASVRYDYDPFTADGRGAFVLRMPDRLHESFNRQVEDRIMQAVTSLVDRLSTAGQAEVAQAVRGFHKGGSTTLEMHAPRLENSSQETGDGEQGIVRRSPDASFFHDMADTNAPLVVLEVSYSQQRKNLRQLADSYIVDSEHETRCMVGFDLAYTAPERRKKTRKVDKTATVAVWRAAVEQNQDGMDVGICRLDMEAQFRREDGEVCLGSLELTLADFLPPDVLAALPPSVADEKISIPFADLASYLDSIECLLAALVSKRSSVTRVKPALWRKRKRSPSEELSDSREAAFARAEEAELTREQQRDGEWLERSRSRSAAGGAQDPAVPERRSNRRLRLSVDQGND